MESVTGAPSGRWCAAYEDLIPALATAMRITCLQLTSQQVTSVADGVSSPAGYRQLFSLLAESVDDPAVTGILTLVS